jgi:hypothetical protein
MYAVPGSNGEFPNGRLIERPRCKAKKRLEFQDVGPDWACRICDQAFGWEPVM